MIKLSTGLVLLRVSLYVYCRSPVRPTLRMRLFCDICDMFDLHDTEDCPQQCNDFEGGTQHHGVRGEERPYCIICESELISFENSVA